MTQPRVKTEEQYDAEQDAHTLAQAHAIMKDPKRMEAAQKAAPKLKDETDKRAKESADHADAMQMLASKMYPTMSGEGSGATCEG